MKFGAIIFDFDGVLVESTDIKTKAFADLYHPYGADVVAKVVAYHTANGGVSRFEKFRHIASEFLGAPVGEAEVERLGEEYSALVEKAVTEAPMVPGAQEFLQQYAGKIPMFVVSGTPEPELLRIIGRRGMNRFFKAAYGSPRKKGGLISGILADNGYEKSKTVMVGDAMADYDGAMEAGVKFVGVVRYGEKNIFPAGVETVADLTTLDSKLA